MVATLRAVGTPMTLIWELTDQRSSNGMSTGKGR
jgi:hypothetical protein